MSWDSFPIDIVLVRHGESEGNLAQAGSKRGDDSLWTPEFSARHTSNYRLTDRGRKQAQLAGEYIRANISDSFDMYFCSEYIRAMETSALLGFKNARWISDFYLREQDKGILGGKSHTEREVEYAETIKRLKKDSFYVAPPGGESIANVCLRVDRVLGNWQSSCPGQRLIAVCHGGIMMAFRVRLEGMGQSQYQEIVNTPEYKINHCHILHYSRRNPETGEIESIPKWKRSINPINPKYSEKNGEWEEIYRPTYTTEQLAVEVNRLPQLINTLDIKLSEIK